MTKDKLVSGVGYYIGGSGGIRCFGKGEYGSEGEWDYEDKGTGAR